MLFGKEDYRKKNLGKYLIGYELSREHIQISFLKIGEDKPYTFSPVAGTEDYNIPLMLTFYREENLWKLGREEDREMGNEAVCLIEDLLTLALDGDPVSVGEITYDPRALLALFIKKSLSLLSLEMTLEKIAGIMFVLDSVDGSRIAALREMADYLSLGETDIRFIGKEESFFWYNLYSEPSLWRDQVLLFELKGNRILWYRLYLNRNTTPIVTIVRKEDCSVLQGRSAKERGEEFLRICERAVGGNKVSAVYLIGEGFGEDWYQEALKYLCRDRRVFRGNNLYSKGACYGIYNSSQRDKLAAAHVFLGEEKLLANVGMELNRRGEASYLVILNGGSSWFDCRKEWEVILEDSNQLEFLITPLNGKEKRIHRMTLKGLSPVRQPLVRLHLKAEMISTDRLLIRVQDRGFGEFYPSSGRIWEEIIDNIDNMEEIG